METKAREINTIQTLNLWWSQIPYCHKKRQYQNISFIMRTDIITRVQCILHGFPDSVYLENRPN